MKAIKFQLATNAIWVAALLLLTACHHAATTTHTDSDNPEKQEELQNPATSLKKEMMSIHEDAMGKIGTLRSLQDSIDDKIAHASQIKSDTAKLSQIEKSLHRCDTAMFGWMNRNHQIANDSADTKAIQHNVEVLKTLDSTMDATILSARNALK